MLFQRLPALGLPKSVGRAFPCKALKSFTCAAGGVSCQASRRLGGSFFAVKKSCLRPAHLVSNPTSRKSGKLL